MGGNGKADLGKKWEWECCDDMGMGGNGKADLGKKWEWECCDN